MDNDALRTLAAELYAPFPLEAHSIREGHKNKAKTKIQWFVYLDRAAIQRRLDELLPLQWSFDWKETNRGIGYVTVTMGITINGITRVFNGGQDGYNTDTPLDSDLEKGAFTEAFRRAASLWGCGLYLYARDFAIWTDVYPDNNWDEAKKRQNEAWAKFEQWYNRKFGIQNQPAVETIEAKPATPKSKQSPAKKPAPASDDSGLERFSCSQIEVVTPQEQKPYIIFYGDKSQKAFAPSRELLRKAGYEVDGWTKAGYYAVTPTALVTARADNENNLNVVEVFYDIPL